MTKKTIKKQQQPMPSIDIWTVKDVCQYFGLSKRTIVRLVERAQNGESTFPLPLFNMGKALRWRRDQITGWKGERTNG